MTGRLVLTGDCREVMGTLGDGTVDAVCTDPPYELGFMGKAWDASGIAYDVAMWAEVLRVLKPGGSLVAFGGTRTSHRMVCAIEDAGFVVRDSLVWLYGSGFPKSLNLGDGYGTALKPAHEPICLARKPLVGTVAANVTEHGTGALNVDGCRVGTADNLNGGAYSGGGKRPEDASSYATGVNAGTFEQPAGRWPPNVLLDDEAAAMVDEQSGERPSANSRSRPDYAASSYHMSEGAGSPVRDCEYAGDTGGASRFFPRFNADSTCVLCSMVYTKECKASAPSVATSSPPAGPLTDSAPGRAAQSERPSPEVKTSASSKRSASTAASRSETTPATAESTAPRGATTQPDACLVRRVQSAASLCDTCATDIARNIVATQRARGPVSLVGLDSMDEHKRQILSRSLALFAVSQGPSDTTPTTAELMLWSGYVASAINTSTTSESRADTPSGQARFLYKSKASTAEREAGLDDFPIKTGGECTDRKDDSDGLNSPRAGAGRRGGRRNTHPTVKPVDLMRWLVRLVTPPGGLVMDHFCGSGTTGMGCALEGFRFIGIDSDEHSAEIARARIRYAEQRRGRPLIAEKAAPVPENQLGLFGGDR